MANITAADVKRAAGPYRRRDDGQQEGARGGRRRRRQCHRDPADQGQRQGPEAGAGRTASAGLVAARVEDGVGTLVEINSETDFVAKSEPFVKLADQVLDQAVKIGATDAETLLNSDVEAGKTVTRAARRGERHDRREDRDPAGRRARGPAHRELPAPDQPRPAAADRRAGGDGRPTSRGRQGRRDAHRGDAARRTSPATTSPPTSWRASGGSPRRRPARRASPSRPAADRRGPRQRRSSRTTCSWSRRSPRTTRRRSSRSLKEAGVNATAFARFKVGA